MAGTEASGITMKDASEKKLGTVTAISLPTEFQFQVNPEVPKPLVQDFVVVPNPMDDQVPMLAKIIAISRFNPLLPEEASMELARLSIDTSLTPLPIGKMEMIAAACQVLGSLDESGRLRNPSFPVKPGSQIATPSAKYIQKALGTIDSDASISIGAVRSRPNIPVVIDANEALNKHVAVLAMTGSGKTYTASVLLEELMSKGYPLLIIDPHGDYVNLGSRIESPRNFTYDFGRQKKGDYKLTVLDKSISITSLRKDDFLDFVQSLAEEEITPPQNNLWAQAYDYAVKSKSSGFKALYEYLSSAGDDDEPKKGGFGGASRKSTIGAVFRQLGHVKRLLSEVEATLSIRDIERALGPGKGVVLDMSLFPYQVQRANVHIILQALFEKRKRFVIQGKTEDSVPPMFVVVEEAHNFAPFEVEGETFPSRMILRRIATEGRKFGFGLCVISQRPSRVDSTVLSQCNSQVILKIVNPNDQNYIRQTVESLAQSDLMTLPDLSQGEALISGAMIKVPTVVKIKSRSSKEGIPAKNRLEEIAEY